MSLYRPVNLPLPVLLTSLSEVGLGLYLTLFRRPPYTSASNDEGPVPLPHALRSADITSLLGITATGLGLTYLVSSYMPVEENQFLHAIVPVRLALSTLMTTTLLIHGRQGMSKEGFWAHVVLAALDGVSALAMGHLLGRYDGIVARPERWAKIDDPMEVAPLL